MVEYLPLILMLLVFLHVIVINKVNHARHPYRMEIAGRFADLRSRKAPQWLLDFWMLPMQKSLFNHGELKWVLLFAMLKKQKMSAVVHQVHRDIAKLPPEIREIHDKMDRAFAIHLMLSSPYFSFFLGLFAILFLGTVELAKIIPAREARGQLVNCARKKAEAC